MSSKNVLKLKNEKVNKSCFTLYADKCTVTGNGNTVYGHENIITGSNNKIIGNKNTVSGNKNNVKGSENEVHGRENTVMGNNNKNENSPKKRPREEPKAPSTDMSYDDRIVIGNVLMGDLLFAITHNSTPTPRSKFAAKYERIESGSGGTTYWGLTQFCSTKDNPISTDTKLVFNIDKHTLRVENGYLKFGLKVNKIIDGLLEINKGDVKINNELVYNIFAPVNKDAVLNKIELVKCSDGDELLQCKICSTYKIGVSLQCGHTYCKECCSKIAKCSFCGNPIEDVRPLFF